MAHTLPEPPELPTSSFPRSRPVRGFGLKIAVICLIVLALHIPLLLTRGVLKERESYQAEANDAVASVWGRQQRIVGPVIRIPYTYRAMVPRQRVVGDKVVEVREAEVVASAVYLLPESLTVTGNVTPEVRQRGIYKTVVYSSALKLTGRFRFDVSAHNLGAQEVQWGRADVLVGLSDLRGLRSISPWRDQSGSTAEFAARPDADQALPLAAPLRGVVEGADVEFQIDLALQGSETLTFAPVGKTSTVSLSSPWPHPSFTGSYLPSSREVTPAGFSATWATTHFSRGFGHSWNEREVLLETMLNRIHASVFGVSFHQAVDGYRLVERARKYGILFFVLVFAVFFLFETTARLKIHPIQYLLVGAALCLFFLGFLSLSEVINVGLAYGAAAAACTLLIGLYAWTFLHTGRRAVLVGVALGGTYGYLFFVVQSQDYALLAGTGAIFAVLAALMYGTRRLNWYQLETEASARPAAEAPASRA